MENSKPILKIPRFLISQAVKKIYEGTTTASAIFTDIVGFTSLTEELKLKIGSNAPEAIHRIIRLYFSQIIAATWSAGGFVASFAGDALTVILPDTRKSECYQLRTTDDMVDFILWNFKTKRLPQDLTELTGRSSLSARVAVGKGQLEYILLKDEAGSWDSFIAGEAVEACLNSHESLSDNYYGRNFDSIILNYQPINAEEDFYIEPLESEFRNVLTLFIVMEGMDIPSLKDLYPKLKGLLKQYGGFLNKIDLASFGPYMLILWGAPRTVAQQIKKSLDFYSSLKKALPVGIIPHAGLTYGRLFSGMVGSDLRGEYTVIGDKVNLAARLAALSLKENLESPLTDNHTVRLANLEATWRGRYSLKGIYEIVGVFTAMGISPTIEREPTFIGRKREKDKIISKIAKCFQQALPVSLYISGPAGIGKTRLVKEVLASFNERNIIGIRGDPLKQEPFWAIKDMMQRKMDLETGQVKTKVLEFLAEISGDLHREISEQEVIFPVLEAVLFSREGTIYESREWVEIFEILEINLISLYRQLASELGGLVFLADDYHWMDDYTKGFLSGLLKLNVPVAVICLSRDENSGEWYTKTNRISLSAFRKNEITLFFTQLAREGSKLEQPLIQYLNAVSKGNPFNLEQTTKYLLEEELVRLDKQTWQLLDKERSLNIENIIVFHIEGLGQVLKRALQMASVLGYRFNAEILNVLLERVGKAQSLNEDVILRSLEEGVILEEVKELIYIFSHVVISDTLYSMLMGESLIFLHRNILEILEQRGEMDFEAFIRHSRACRDDEKLGYYLHKGGSEDLRLGLYGRAQYRLNESLSLIKELHGENYPEYATILNDLAVAFEMQGQYKEAEDLYRNVLKIAERIIGKEHHYYANYVLNLAGVLGVQDKYKQAEQLYSQGLEISKETIGKEHPNYAAGLIGLARILQDQGKYEQAERMCRQAIEIAEKTIGKNHPQYANHLSDLASVLNAQMKYKDAMELYQLALKIDERTIGKNHPSYANVLNGLAVVQQELGRYDQAEELYRQALKLSEKTVGTNHPYYTGQLKNLADVLISQGKYKNAERYYRQGLQITEQTMGTDNHIYAKILGGLGDVLRGQGKYIEAENLYRQSLAIGEQIYDNTNPKLALYINNLAVVLKDQAEYNEAEELCRQACDLVERSFGPNNPHLPAYWSNLAGVLKARGKHHEAEGLYRQVLQVCEQTIGKENPNYITYLNNLAVLLADQGKHPEAEELYRQAGEIGEKKD